MESIQAPSHKLNASDLALPTCTSARSVHRLCRALHPHMEPGCLGQQLESPHSSLSPFIYCTTNGNLTPLHPPRVPAFETPTHKFDWHKGRSCDWHCTAIHCLPDHEQYHRYGVEPSTVSFFGICIIMMSKSHELTCWAVGYSTVRFVCMDCAVGPSPCIVTPCSSPTASATSQKAALPTVQTGLSSNIIDIMTAITTGKQHSLTAWGGAHSSPGRLILS